MMLMDAGARALDYFPCRYGASKAVFRGPERDLTRPYIAMLGGSPTFGKYVERPFPLLVEQALGVQVANLAGMNAGPDFYLSDPAALAVARGARAAVVQLTGAEAMSNPFYTVHSRRSDRFLTATPALRALYPQVDFTEIHFTRHLLMVLQRTDADRFQAVVQGLKTNWLARMQALLAELPGCRVLLWLADSAPPAVAVGLDTPPLFVDRAMLDALCRDGTAVVEAVPSSRARAMARFDMIYPETEATQAACLPGAAVHVEVAARLVPALTRRLPI
jgi:Domain of unknown function (DUF6473)